MCKQHVFLYVQNIISILLIVFLVLSQGAPQVSLSSLHHLFNTYSIISNKIDTFMNMMQHFFERVSRNTIKQFRRVATLTMYVCI